MSRPLPRPFLERAAHCAEGPAAEALLPGAGRLQIGARLCTPTRWGLQGPAPLLPAARLRPQTGC